MSIAALSWKYLVVQCNRGYPNTDPKKSTTLMKKVYSLPSVLKRNSFDSAVSPLREMGYIYTYIYLHQEEGALKGVLHK